MRLLVFTDSLNPSSGWGMYSAALVNVLRKQGVQITVLTADMGSEGVNLPKLEEGIREWAVGAWRFWRWWREVCSSFDGVHVFVEPYARFAFLFRKPFCVTVHGTYVAPSAHGPVWAQYLFRRALREAARIVSISHFTASRLPVDVMTKPSVIPNGVDLSLQDQSFALPSHVSHPLILSVGAIKPRKGFDHLIRGFEVFLRTHVGAQLVIVGAVLNREEYHHLEKLVTELNIGSHVIFTGRVSREELLGWYRVCDVFALTPVEKGGFEGFGLVYLEAGVFGKPCVGSLGSGAGEAIEDGATGYLIAPSDPEGLAVALERSLAIDGQKIIKKTQEKSWEKRGVEYWKLYKELF